jgi:hypothetical protein
MPVSIKPIHARTLPYRQEGLRDANGKPRKGMRNGNRKRLILFRFRLSFVQTSVCGERWFRPGFVGRRADDRSVSSRLRIARQRLDAVGKLDSARV